MPAPTAKQDPTPPFARQVLALFGEDALAEVHFPDLDLAVLQEAQTALLTAQLEVERAEAQLEAARAAREEKLVALEAKAERALAYARVFASGDADLGTRLAEVGRRKPAPTSEGAPVKKRGRPKRTPDGAELFGDGVVSDVVVHDA